MIDPAANARLDALIEEGFEIFDRFDATTRGKMFHPFVAADYVLVLEKLLELQPTIHPPQHRAGRPAFLELGSATGVIAILADLIGFDGQPGEDGTGGPPSVSQLASERPDLGPVTPIRSMRQYRRFVFRNLCSTSAEVTRI
jgi:hypothetical protein